MAGAAGTIGWVVGCWLLERGEETTAPGKERRQEEAAVPQETMVSGLEKQSLVDLDAYPDCVPPHPPQPRSQTL